jgi:hypothetical protein
MSENFQHGVWCHISGDGNLPTDHAENFKFCSWNGLTLQTCSLSLAQCGRHEYTQNIVRSLPSSEAWRRLVLCTRWIQNIPYWRCKIYKTYHKTSHYTKSSSIPHIDTGPSVSSMFWTRPVLNRACYRNTCTWLNIWPPKAFVELLWKISWHVSQDWNKIWCTLAIPFSDTSWKSPHVTYTTPNKRVGKLPTSTQLRAPWHSDSLEMIGLTSTGASRYHNCCLDGGFSPEYFGCHLAYSYWHFSKSCYLFLQIRLPNTIFNIDASVMESKHLGNNGLRKVRYWQLSTKKLINWMEKQIVLSSAI